MKKSFFLLITGLLLTFFAAECFAQETEETEVPDIALAQRFPALVLRDRFNEFSDKTLYYRFAPDTLFYEPLDLSYFPHEKWTKEKWATVGRWTDGRHYNQILYLDSPADRQIMHGTDTGEKRGFLRDFYLYITLFCEDNYPQETGSCYIYFSDSLMIGFKESKGILIDPQTGIYEATNSYGGARHSTYTQSTIKHQLEPITGFAAGSFDITPEDAETSSIGAAAYPHEKLNEEFAKDWETLNESFRMKAAAPVKAYRIEIIRQDGTDEVYINGKLAASIYDPIKTINARDEIVPEKVSWSYGPILNEGGLTVTCSVGDFYIFGTGKYEE